MPKVLSRSFLSLFGISTRTFTVRVFASAEVLIHETLPVTSDSSALPLDKLVSGNGEPRFSRRARMFRRPDQNFGNSAGEFDRIAIGPHIASCKWTQR
jgi:hypothetical protein